MNEVYRTYFPDAPPARATLITGFVVPGILVEIEGIAVLD
jgi:enamine deaminase RidA (YjgF/YER057c/UK114 family)